MKEAKDNTQANNRQTSQPQQQNVQQQIASDDIQKAPQDEADAFLRTLRQSPNHNQDVDMAYSKLRSIIEDEISQNSLQNDAQDKKITTWDYTKGRLTIKFERKKYGLNHSVLVTLHSAPQYKDGKLCLNNASFTVFNHTAPHLPLNANLATQQQYLHEEYALGQGGFGLVKPIRTYDVSYDDSKAQYNISAHTPTESALKIIKFKYGDGQMTQPDIAESTERLLLALREYNTLEKLSTSKKTKYDVALDIGFTGQLDIRNQIERRNKVYDLLSTLRQNLKEQQEIDSHITQQIDSQQQADPKTSERIEQTEKTTVDVRAYVAKSQSIQEKIDNTVAEIMKNNVQKVRIVMPREQGSTLEKTIEMEMSRKRAVLPDHIRLQIGYEALKKLKDMHDTGFVHNDIKPENMMMNVAKDGNVNVEYIDYGLASKVNEIRSTNRGTPVYMPPECMCITSRFGWSDILNQYKSKSLYMQSDPKSDMYSLGLVFSGKTGECYFSQKKPTKCSLGGLFRQYIKKLRHSPHPQAKKFVNGMSNLVLKMTSQNINERPTAAKALTEYVAMESDLKNSLQNVQNQKATLLEYLTLNIASRYDGGKEHNKRQMLQYSATHGINNRSTAEQFGQSIIGMLAVVTAKYGFVDKFACKSKKRADNDPIEFFVDTKMTQSLLNTLNNPNSPHSFECKKLIVDTLNHLSSTNVIGRLHLNEYAVWTPKDMVKIINAVGAQTLRSAMKNIPPQKTQNADNSIAI